MNPVACNIPRVGDALERSRLFDLMAGQGENRVVLLTGQAAQGKSTLVASFLDREAKPCIWVHLTRKASDHVWLFETLFKGLRQLSADPETLVQVPHTTLGSREDLTRQIDLLVTGIEEFNRPLDIVFDDLETLDDEGSSWGLIKGLMENTRDLVRFFLLSRTLPPLSLPSLKMEKGCLAITNEDLAFTRDEIKDFFRKKPEKGEILPGQIEKIFAATEGWAGGLVLVSESLPGAMDLSSLPPRLTFDAFSYFSEEIYGTLPGDIRQFLMETSIFDELDIEILSCFFNKIDPLPVLEELVRRNLFIQKINPGGPWPVFKYNNLFRGFLSAHLKKTLGRKAFRQLNKKAGQVFWEKKDPEKAIRYFMEGKAHGQVAKIIRTKGTDYVIGGREACLGDWILALPEEMVDQDPWLIFFKATAARIKGGRKNLFYFQQALAMFMESRDTRGVLLSTAYLIEAAVFIRQPSSEIIKWIGSGQKSLSSMGGELRFAWARTLLWQQIGLGFIAGSGDIPKGISACRNAILLATHIENQDLLLNASIILCLGLVQSGDFTGARQMLERIQDITHEGGHPEYRALKHMTNIDFALKKGDFALAGKLLVKIEADIEKFGLIFLYPGFVEARAVHGACMGQFSQALKAADHLHDFSILEGNDFYLGISHRVKALAFLLDREYETAKTFACMAVEELSNSRRGDIHLFQARKIYGLALFCASDFLLAREELIKALEYFDSIGSDLCFCETSLALGLLEAQAQNKDQAVSYFKRGVQKAVEKKYVYFPLLPPQLLAKILVHLHLIFPAREGMGNPNQGVYPLQGQLAAFSRGVAQGLSNPVREIICGLWKGTDKKQKAEQVEKLTSLYRMTLPTIQIFTLGEFSVQAGGNLLEKSAFGGPKPMLLLKAIISRGARDIPKEILIDTLWPDAGPGAGEKNLKINLHRLRKALEPDPVKAFGYSYLGQKSGKISLDPDLVLLDTDKFVGLAAEGRANEASDSGEAALDCYSRAARIYRGDYFTDDPYLEWLTRPRDDLRAKYIAVLDRKARLHEDLGQWQEAVEAWRLILEADPCFETAFRNLMILYGDSGRTGEAIQVFNECRAVLKKELDARPHASTFGVYQRIRNL